MYIFPFLPCCPSFYKKSHPPSRPLIQSFVSFRIIIPTFFIASFILSSVFLVFFQFPLFSYFWPMDMLQLILLKNTQVISMSAMTFFSPFLRNSKVNLYHCLYSLTHFSDFFRCHCTASALIQGYSCC